MSAKTKVIIVGAGPVGSLAALYSAQRGYDVEIYELRNGTLTDHHYFQSIAVADVQTDLRLASTVPLNFTKSINLALSCRGITAMQNAEPKAKDGERKLLDHVLAATIPMRGRMIHGKKANGELYENAQDYDVHGRVSSLSLYLSLPVLHFIRSTWSCSHILLDNLRCGPGRSQQAPPRRA